MSLIIDTDSHFIEPKDLWENYLEGKYKEWAFRFVKDPATGEEIIIAGKARVQIPMKLLRVSAGFGLPPERLVDPTLTLYDGPAAAYDPGERVKWLDAEGIDKQFIHPTLGLLWEGFEDDPEVAAAYCRAYNNWLWETCGPYKDRLVLVAHISLWDVEEAVRELRRVAKLGIKGVFIGSRPLGGRSFGHPCYDPFWAEAQEIGIPVTIHTSGNEKYVGGAWHEDPPPPVSYQLVMIAEDPRIALATMLYDGVFERFPRLKVVIAEAKSGWIDDLLERLDHKFGYLGFQQPWLKMKPSEYFRRQCFIQADPEEKTLPTMIELWGEDKFFWGSDFPHAEGFPNPVKETKERLKACPASTQRKVLGENAAQVYGL